MDLEKFEAELRLGVPFEEKWKRPDINEVQVAMFRKRGKLFTWRPMIDPHIAIFYDDPVILGDALEQIDLSSTSTPKVERNSLRAYWYSFSHSEALETAKDTLSTSKVRFYPFGLESLLEDIEKFRQEREGLRISHGQWVHPSVGATLFIVDLDSAHKEEVKRVVDSGLLEHLLFKGHPDRVYLMLVSKDASSVPPEIFPLVEFGCFMGDNEKFVNPYIKDTTFIHDPLVFRDSRGKFYSKWRDESGDLYDKRYSLNTIGKKVTSQRDVERGDFLNWIEGLDDGS